MAASPEAFASLIIFRVLGHQEPLPAGWVEELPLDYHVYVGKDADPEDLRQIHLYRVL